MLNMAQDCLLAPSASPSDVDGFCKSGDLSSMDVSEETRLSTRINSDKLFVLQKREMSLERTFTV